jgi:hypothetical protein
MEVSGGQLHASAALPQGESPRYPLHKRLGGPQSRSGRDGEEKNSHSPPVIEHRSSDHPARSQSLYRLSYPGSKVAPVLQQALSHDDIWSGDIAPCVLNLGTRWRWMIASRSLHFTSKEKAPAPLDRWMSGPQKPVRMRWRREKSLL